jgi:flagellar hook-associated protein 2
MSFIDGLSTGLDTTSIIKALLDVERLPQTRIIARRETSQAASKQLGDLRTKVSSFRNTAADLRFSSAWQKLSGTSTSDAVAVDASSGGFTGAVTFRVESLATSNVIYSNSVFASMDSQVGTSGTLREVIDAINSDPNKDYSAVAINTGAGFRLQLASDTSGLGASVVADPALAIGAGGFSTLTDGADAKITFDGVNPYSITSSTNTFENIMPGVDVTVSQASLDPVTVTVGRNYEEIADAVGAMVEQYNEMKKALADATRVDPELDRQGPLAFNSNVRRSEQGLSRALVDPVGASTFNAPSLVGIELQRDGTITFDRDEFIEAAKTDLDDLTRMFVSPGEGEEAGILDRLVAAAENASTYGTGLLSSAEESEKARIESFTEQIDAFEERLERKEAQLRRLYSGLEVAIGNLNSQSNWLAGQLNSLNNNSES